MLRIRPHWLLAYDKNKPTESDLGLPLKQWSLAEKVADAVLPPAALDPDLLRTFPPKGWAVPATMMLAGLLPVSLTALLLDPKVDYPRAAAAVSAAFIVFVAADWVLYTVLSRRRYAKLFPDDPLFANRPQ